MGIPSQSYRASPAIWDHTVYTCHPTRVNAPRLNPSQTGQYSIYLPRRDERLSSISQSMSWRWCCLYTEVVYLPAYRRPSFELTTFWWHVGLCPSRYTTKPPCLRVYYRRRNLLSTRMRTVHNLLSIRKCK